MDELKIDELEKTELQNPYDQLLDYVKELIPYDFAALYRVNEKTSCLEIVSRRGDVKELAENMKFRFGEGLSAWVAEWKKPILLTRKKNGNNTTPVGAFLSIPLWLSGKLLGVLSLGSHKPEGFGIKELKLSKLFSEQIAFYMEKVNFLNQLKETYIDLQKSVEEFEGFYKKLLKREKEAEQKEQEFSLQNEIRNPLSLIIGNAELLLRELDGSGDEIKKRLKRIIDEGQKLAQTTNLNLKGNNLPAHNAGS